MENDPKFSVRELATNFNVSIRIILNNLMQLTRIILDKWILSE